MFENEAESMSAHEEESRATDQNYLDTCPVCRLNFYSREPKLLPCLHSFCKKCLPSPSRHLAMAEPPNSQVDMATKPLNVIRCPVCRQECMEVDVMENIFVKDSVEAPSSTERTVQLCMTCDDNTEAAGFCVTCVEYLCATCVEAHQRVKFTRDHTIRQRAEVPQEARDVSTQRPMFCDIHKQEPLKLFCETCDLLTCRDCQLAKHKDHNYQFLEEAYKNHKRHMESMTHQLQDKMKLIEEVSNSIKNGLLQVDQNRKSVRYEIKKSICSLILEINKKGKMLLNQLEAVAKDHESVLRKQDEDIGYLSRHLDHVINFTKWATARDGGTALLHCKRLILFQIENLLRVKCSTSFIPQCTVRFQCPSSYWASNVDPGSLVVESVPGHQLGAYQGIPHHFSHPGQFSSGSPHSFALGGAPHNTLAQLQMQVDKLNPPAPQTPQPCTLYQSVRLQQTVPVPVQGGSSSNSMSSQRFMVHPPNHTNPTSSLLGPGFTPQPLRGMGSHSYQSKPMEVFASSPLYNHIPTLQSNGGISSSQSHHMIDPTHLNRRNDSGVPIYMLKPNYLQGLPPSLPHTNVQGQQDSPDLTAVSQEEEPGTVPGNTPETHQANGAVGSAVKKRRRSSSPGPIIVIKDEPDEYSSYVHANQRASLPDSTGDHPQFSAHDEGNGEVLTTLQSTDDKPHRRSLLSKTNAPNPICSYGGEQYTEQHQAPMEDSYEVMCAVCRTADWGELLCCNKCPKVFHLSCHVPTVVKSPSGEWLCSLCRDLLATEMENENKPEGAKTVKKEPGPEGGFFPVDKRKCERLLLQLFCSDLSSDFQDPVPPSARANDWLPIKGAMKLSTVKKRLEAKQSVCYQSPAEFVSDIRRVFGGCIEADADSTMAGRKLKELFEEHLKTIFPDQTFPEIKLETVPTTIHTDSQHSSIEPAKRQRTFYTQ